MSNLLSLYNDSNNCYLNSALQGILSLNNICIEFKKNCLENQLYKFFRLICRKNYVVKTKKF